MEQKNIFQVIAEGVGTTNQNVCELFKLVQEVSDKIDALGAKMDDANAKIDDAAEKIASVESALYPVANEGGDHNK
jgi:peptidoglycan hydrolase CwlO-like protein